MPITARCLITGGNPLRGAGAGKQKSTDPPIHLLNPRPTHPPPAIRFFFPLTFVFSTFLGVSRQGEFKNSIKIFLQKVHVENKSKISTKISMSVFPRLFMFYRVFGCFSAMGVQKHYKKRFTKKIVSKSFYKTFDQKSKNRLFLVFCLSRFWAFLEGRSKTRLKKYRKKSDPSPFSYSDPPTHHGGHRFVFFAGPLIR
jgi:hypothetical protein